MHLLEPLLMLALRGRLPVLLLFTAALYLALTYLPLTPSNLPSLSTNNHDPHHHKPSSIPLKIWQTWHTPLPQLPSSETSLIQTWHVQNPSHRYELLTDTSASTYISAHFSSSDEDRHLRDTYLNLTDPILRADFLRYLVLLADGGVYADLDVECRVPIAEWIPPAFQAQGNSVGVVVGIESDRPPVENDVKLYHDHRTHIWGVTNWTFAAKRGHALFRSVANAVANNLHELARKQGRELGSIESSYNDVILATGPRAFSNAFLAYLAQVEGKGVTGMDLSMLEEPKRVGGDVLVLPIRAFSVAEAEREGVQGAARSVGWRSLVFHWSRGSWKGSHYMKGEGEEGGSR
ncbi:hypothetical protein ACLMJK_009331 [Lecanora helva]